MDDDTCLTCRGGSGEGIYACPTCDGSGVTTDGRNRGGMIRPMVSMPVEAILYERKVRVVKYEGDGRWMILDWNDQYRIVNGFDLTFLP